MFERDRKRHSLSVGQAAWRLGVKVWEYRELEAGTRWPSFDAYDRAAKLYGWPQTFVDPYAGAPAQILRDDSANSVQGGGA